MTRFKSPIRSNSTAADTAAPASPGPSLFGLGWWRFATLLAGWLLAIAPAAAQAPTSIKLSVTIDIDPVGKAGVKYDLSMPAQNYALLKSTVGDAFHVIRSIESSSGWLELENISARFEDQLQSVVSNCDAIGLMRTTAPGKWSISLGRPQDGFELLDIHNNQAIFANVAVMPLGIVRMYTRINLPKGSKDIAYNARRGELTYDFTPDLPAGTRTSIDNELQAQEHIMSSLAKLYSTEFSPLYAARNTFTNTGDQPVHDYRIRFRLDGYSSWSPWNKCKIVYPGQAVMDYYYPVLDIDKLAELNGTRHAMIETEFEYVTEDGEKVHETDARRVQLMSRNEVVYSSRADGENLNWSEQFDLAPYILTCFTNGTDPVMQQFAGRISALANGPASSLNSEHAIHFLNTMWTTLQANKLSYQTSPSLTLNNHFGQHIKYGRDVLRNRAGTCIDLAILWASAAESVGLKPYIAIIPGHAFPVIELPNGNKIPIESTMIGSATLEQAVEQGLKTLKESQENGQIMLVDIADLKNNQNVRPLDLPKASEDVLTKWGYRLDESINQGTTVEKSETPPQRQSAQRPRTEPTAPAYIGYWKMTATYNGVQIEGSQVFTDDGRYACIMINTYPDGSRERIEEKGTYIDHGTHFEFHTTQGDYDQRYRWNNGRLEMEFPTLNSWLYFDRVKGD